MIGSVRVVVNRHLTKLKKNEIIHAIQKAENNIACYGTERVEFCNEENCLWRSDCLALHGEKSA